MCAVSASANELAVRYLLELSTDIRGALLLDRDGRAAGQCGAAGPPTTSPRSGNGSPIPPAGCRKTAGSRAVANGSTVAIEIDVLSSGGAMFLLGEADLIMACVTNRNVHPGLIFYDMHAVLRDLERAAAAESLREHEGAR